MLSAQPIRKHAAFLAFLAFSIGIHASIFGDALNPDATTYVEVSRSLVLRGSLRIETTLVPQHPPLMAILLIPFELAFGFNEFAVHFFELTAFGLLLVLLYATSRRLGPLLSFGPIALLTFDPVLYLNMSDGRALCVLMILTLLTLLAIWRGLEDPRWLVVAAGGSSLAYLTADSVGYLYIAAGLGGLLWRFYYIRWYVFLNRWYLMAMSLFLGVVFLWTGYNLVSKGTPYTDPRVVGYLDRLFVSTPLDVQIVVIGGFAAYFLVYLGQTGFPFILLREARLALTTLPTRTVHDQRIGALMLFIAMTVAISAVLSSAFVLYEPLRTLDFADTYLRYAAVAAPVGYIGVGMLARSCSGSGRALFAPVAIGLLILLAQFVPQVVERDASRDRFIAIQRDLIARNLTSVYSDFAVYLRYNIPEISFLSVDKGYSTPIVNLTTDDVPLGSPLLTVIYVPVVYDERIDGLYLIYRFDPSIHSSFTNLYYRG